MKKTITALVAATALTLTACGDTADEAAGPNASTTEAETTLAPMHEALTNGGVTLTVDEVTVQPTELLEPDGYKKGAMPPEEVTPENQGAKFVKVATTVRNDGTQPWDLTCSYHIDAVLADADGREYSPIDSLYRVPENPECNDSLGPGFEHAMSWVYEVPEAMDPAFFGFFDPDENYGDTTWVEIQAS